MNAWWSHSDWLMHLPSSRPCLMAFFVTCWMSVFVYLCVIPLFCQTAEENVTHVHPAPVIYEGWEVCFPSDSIISGKSRWIRMKSKWCWMPTNRKQLQHFLASLISTGHSFRNIVRSLLHSIHSTPRTQSSPGPLRLRQPFTRSCPRFPHRSSCGYLPHNFSLLLRWMPQRWGLENHLRLPETFSCRAQIWCDHSDLPVQGDYHKLAHRFVGPFPIAKVINPSAGCLHVPWNMRVHSTFNISQIKAVKTCRMCLSILSIFFTACPWQLHLSTLLCTWDEVVKVVRNC